MSSVLYLEPVGGIAGDMFLAAMIDLGVDARALEAGLRTLGLDGWGFEVTRAVRQAISGVHLNVEVSSEVPH
ncbi:MAG TPA: nickel insertion protein, partial [Myxococcaceae bacterium]